MIHVTQRSGEPVAGMVRFPITCHSGGTQANSCVMKRIVIIGSPGSGKSTLARQLGAALDLPVHHLDALFWKPGWEEADPIEFADQIRELAMGDEWIIDGGYVRLDPDELRFKRGNIVLLLQRSRWLCLFRVIARVFKFRNQTRPDMGEACPEKLEWVLLSLIWHYPKRNWPELLARVERNATPHIILAENADVQSLIDQMKQVVRAAPSRSTVGQ